MQSMIISQLNKKAKSRSYLLCLITLLPFFEPRIFFNYPSFAFIDRSYVVMQVAVFVAVMIKYILSKRYSVCFIGILSFRAAALICTLMASNTIDIGWFSKTVVILGAAVGIELFLRKDPLMTLRCLYAIMFVPLVINCIMCVLGISVSTGEAEYYFIGMRTQFPNSMFPCITLSLMISYIEDEKLITRSSVTTLIVCIIQLISQWVGTGILLVFVQVGMLMYIRFYRANKGLSAPILLLISFVLDYLIVFVRVQDLFAFFIVGVLHKDLTFTGRTPIWDFAIKSFKQRPIWGYGELGNGGFVNVYWANRPAPAHNTLLQILHDGGLVELIVLMLFMFGAAYLLMKKRRNMLSSIVAINLLVVGIEMISEVLHYQIYFFLPLILACNLNYFTKTEGIDLRKLILVLSLQMEDIFSNKSPKKEKGK